MLFNHSLNFDIFLDCLKTAKVIPIFKNRNKRKLAFIDQYPPFQSFLKFLKNCLSLECVHF